MDSPDKPDRKTHEQDRMDRIAAYLDGEMTPEEAAAFERLMATDETLRREVAQWREAYEAGRDWVASEPPGVERANNLAIPSVAARRSRGAWFRLHISPYAWRTVTAAAVFVAGFIVGFMAHPQVSPTEDRWEIERGVEEVIAQPPPDPAQIGGEESGKPIVEPQPERPVELAQLPALRGSVDEKGRIIIETGARAVWVVDGNFQISQTRLIAKGEQP